MKKWTVGMIAAALLVSMANAWAEDGAGAEKKEREQKREHKQVKEQAQNREEHQKGRRGEDRGAMMKAADKDQDGKITLEEFTEAHLARIKEMFEKMDVNKDGVLTEEDRVAARAAREAQGDKAKKAEDTDKGGDKDED